MATYNDPCRKYAGQLLVQTLFNLFFLLREKDLGKFSLKVMPRSLLFTFCSSNWAAIGNNWYIFLNTVVFEDI